MKHLARPARAGSTTADQKEWFYNHTPEMPIQTLNRFNTIIDNGISWSDLEQLALAVGELMPFQSPEAFKTWRAAIQEGTTNNLPGASAFPTHEDIMFSKY